MKAILVDDEPLALIGLQKALENEISDIDIPAAYSNPKEAIAGAMEHRPDVVFLDIHMPEVDGLKLGKQIQAVVPGVEIVFVTSYDQYAVRAFELYALDYIMKPIQTRRLNKTIMRIKEKLDYKQSLEQAETNAPIICCFNHIRFKLPGMSPQLVVWRTSRAQELFIYLLHHRARTISRSVLFDLLWPDAEEAMAVQNLYTTIYQIRQTLKAYKMDMVSVKVGGAEAGYRLEIGEARVDSDVWEYELKQLGAVDANTVDDYERVLSKYEGDYLHYYDFIWAEHERERLRLLWLYHMSIVSEFFVKEGMLDRAVQVNRQIQLMSPDEEESYFSMMKLYHAMDHKSGVEEQYALLKAKVEGELELPVSDHIVGWYEHWRSLAYRR